MDDVKVNNAAMKYFNYNEMGVAVPEGVRIECHDDYYTGGGKTRLKNDGECLLYDYTMAASEEFCDEHDDE